MPMMQGIADRVNLLELSRKFNLIQESHKDELGAKYIVLHLYGTIFTRYDRELARVLQEENNFKDVLQQDRYVTQQMERKISQFEEIGRKMTKISFNEIPLREMVRSNLSGN